VSNILEDVFPIDRLEKPIEGLSVSTSLAPVSDPGGRTSTVMGRVSRLNYGCNDSLAGVIVTTTRNCVGVWNMQDGRLLEVGKPKYYLQY